jgi:hypothetical protein
LQLTDVYSALGYREHSKESPAKLDLIANIQTRLGWYTLKQSTSPSSTRFNIWQWRPSAQSQVKSKRPRS